MREEVVTCKIVICSEDDQATKHCYWWLVNYLLLYDLLSIVHIRLPLQTIQIINLHWKL